MNEISGGGGFGGRGSPTRCARCNELLRYPLPLGSAPPWCPNCDIPGARTLTFVAPHHNEKVGPLPDEYRSDSAGICMACEGSGRIPDDADYEALGYPETEYRIVDLGALHVLAGNVGVFASSWAARLYVCSDDSQKDIRTPMDKT